MKRNIVNNYGSFETVFTHAEGATLYDTDGKAYIDFIAGIGVNSLGHNYGPLVRALSEQAGRIIHVSNYYFSDTGLKFADRLLEATGFEGGYFGNSGAEANEAAIKLARKYGYINGGESRRTIVTLEKSFHGRTIAALTATGQDIFHPACFAPYPAGFKTIKGNDSAGLKELDSSVAALFIECVQGEGGVNLLDTAWVKEAAAAAREAGAIVMADEVQTGMGRCGSLLASDTMCFSPDVVTLAKGIAGGVPMGACLFRGKAAGVFQAGDHQSTFAGNPLASCAGLVVLETLTKKGFMEEVRRKGDLIRGEIAKWKLSAVADVRGRGLMIGVELLPSLKPFDVEKRCLEEGLCVSTAGTNVIRFLPPLTISDAEIEKGLDIFKKVLSA